MKITCSYVNESGGYKCNIFGLEIPFRGNHKFTGIHEHGMTNWDVKKIEFEECITSRFPQNLTGAFPNLEEIELTFAGLIFLCRDDLAEYNNLKIIDLSYNAIEFIPGDLFADCHKLEKVNFSRNSLKFVDPKVFDGLKNLKTVHLGKEWINTPNGYKEEISAINNKVNEEFRKIEEQKMRALSDENQKLKAENQNLKAENQNVKAENQKVKAENQKLTDEAQNLNAEIEKHKPIKCFIQSNETLKDLYINIEDRQFHVHKLLLAARSPTIAEILNNNPEAENLNLVDISVDIFEDILKFLYTDELPQNVDYKKLFAATGRLKIKELMDFSARKLLEELNDENALELLNLGNKFGHKRMRTTAFEGIKRKYPRIEFKDEMSEDGEKIEKMIEILKKKEDIMKKQEEAIKKLQEEMKSLVD